MILLCISYLKKAPCEKNLNISLKLWDLYTFFEDHLNVSNNATGKISDLNVHSYLTNSQFQAILLHFLYQRITFVPGFRKKCLKSADYLIFGLLFQENCSSASCNYPYLVALFSRLTGSSLSKVENTDSFIIDVNMCKTNKPV